MDISLCHYDASIGCLGERSLLKRRREAEPLRKLCRMTASDIRSPPGQTESFRRKPNLYARKDALLGL